MVRWRSASFASAARGSFSDDSPELCEPLQSSCPHDSCQTRDGEDRKDSRVAWGPRFRSSVGKPLPSRPLNHSPSSRPLGPLFPFNFPVADTYETGRTNGPGAGLPIFLGWTRPLFPSPPAWDRYRRKSWNGRRCCCIDRGFPLAKARAPAAPLKNPHQPLKALHFLSR